MNNDKELLELAAKAAGIDGPHQVNAQGAWVFHSPRKKNWNPFTDDSAALRLAVKLRIAVTYPEGEDCVRVWFGVMGSAPLYETLGTDPGAATRRAIVRAAAEIGKARA